MNGHTSNSYGKIGSIMNAELVDRTNKPLVGRNDLPSGDGMTTFVGCHENVFSGCEDSRTCDEKACSNKLVSLIVNQFQNGNNSLTAYYWRPCFIFKAV